MILEQFIPHYDYILVIEIKLLVTRMLVEPWHTYGSTFLFDTIN